MNPEDRFGIRNAKLGFVIRRMEASLNVPIYIEDLAAGASLSVRQLERLFHLNLGKSPSQFYITLRLARARELLLNTNLGVAKIAETCGYQSASHFSRIFRQYFDESPAATRKSDPTYRPARASY
jgi:transcriptional regulator GlxA family with amidase domain